jgi:hypothetical protein
MIFKQNFENDFDIIKEFVERKEKFSFSKFADGEIAIMKKNKIRNIDNWLFEPDKDEEFSNLLYGSFKYNDEGYYIGISCPCCDLDGYKWLKLNLRENFSNFTFANIFVNNNYNRFKTELLPLFNKFDNIIFVGNKNSNLERIFEVLKFKTFYGIGPEAFKTDLGLIDDLINSIKNENIKDALFLFSAGPLGNVLSHKLWEFSKDNTYIDIGSTMNTWTGLNLRDYQLNGVYSNKICNF